MSEWMVLEEGFKDGESIATAWKNQYFHDGKWGYLFIGSSEKIYQGIIAAKDDRIAIEKAVGSPSWTQVWCNAHKGYGLSGVLFGDESSLTVCFTCLEKALKLKPIQKETA